MITLVGSVPAAKCVILMVAGTGTSGCYTVIEMESSLSFVQKASLKEANRREPSYKESSLTQLQETPSNSASVNKNNSRKTRSSVNQKSQLSSTGNT